ncbi:methyltransferase [Histoplasma capsulatum H143]|uniref:Methyltransferase n=1 Tax=Ajellomyces capsulatus (strain H143) TaxID=544712 RepID=C6HBB7_AJECH|nr:methyltransferase [Histoplasma capsulatum H143]
MLHNGADDMVCLSHALAVQERLKDFYIPNIISITHEGNPVDPPHPVPWYPDQLAWSMTTPKNVIRRFAPFASFQKFLVAETAVGNISRQEVVSMIPPLVLDVRPGMTVLDMCAAPGSKSAQLMELVHAGEEERMAEIAKRLETAADAERRKGTVNVPKLLNGEMESDADVPCSGDGTTRKNVNVWKDWNPANALGLHLTHGGGGIFTCSMNPVKTKRDCECHDRCGGPSKVHIMDCSNELSAMKRSPGLTTWTVMDKQGRIWANWKDVEEAVSEGDVTLNRIVEGMFPPAEEEGIDLSRCMRVYPHQQDTGAFFIAVLEKKSDIKARPEGAKKPTSTSAPEPTTENLTDRDGTNASVELTGVSDEATPVESHVVPVPVPVTQSLAKRAFEVSSEDLANKRQKVEESHLTVPSAPSVEEVPELQTQQEAAVPPISEESQPHVYAEQKPTVSTAPVFSAKRRPGQPVEEPFKYLDRKNEEFDQIFSFYDISPQFPRDRFMVRNFQGRPAKTIYYTSTLARDILTANEGAGIKFVHAGVKMFVKQDVQRQDVCPWRIQTDGLAILESWVGPRRVVKIYQKETLRKLLIEMFPKVNDNGWKQLGEIGEWARDIDMGCCVLRIEPTDNEDGFRERMVLPLWRSMYSLNLMLPKEERRAMLLRLYDDETPLVNTTNKRKEAAAANPDQTSDASDAVANGQYENSADVPTQEDDTEAPLPVEENKS